MKPSLFATFGLGIGLTASAMAAAPAPAAEPLSRLAHHTPGLLADLGVGLWAWPLPLDYNRDGLMDLVVVCTDKPYNGTWYFENSGEVDPQLRLPIFKPARLLGKSAPSAGISYVTGQPIVTATASVKQGDVYAYRGNVFPDFLNSRFDKPAKIAAPEKILTEAGNIRQNQWKFVDYDGDGALDLTIGIDFWGDYGWDAAFNAAGDWIRGPLHGYVYLLRNTGTTAKPVYAEPVRVHAGGKPVDPFGMPSPMWGDFDGDGDLDLICGEFRDSFTFYENTGTRTKPEYAAGRQLLVGGAPLLMDLCMITPTAVDFDGDGDLDIVCGDEDGRVAFIENTGKVSSGTPQFLPPRYFRQFAADVKFGALATPYAFDWDGDGDEDLISGNSAGYVAFIENLGGTPVRWAAPRYLTAGGRVIREQAGPNGSIQGPAEAKWGYSILSVADWDGDGLPDLMTNGIWGKVVWYRNIGTRTAPRLAPAQPVEVAPGTTSPKPAWNWWNPQGREFVTQWRTTPQMIDWNGDGLMDLVMADHEGYLALFERKRAADGSLVLSAAQRVFWSEGASVFNSNGQPQNKESGLLQINNGVNGRGGRRTFCIVDWDGDGQRDLLMNSSPNVNFFRGLGRDAQGRWKFRDEGPVSPYVLAGHATKPTTGDWDKDGLPDLLIGAEDGFFYQVKNPRARR
ncbi:MAG: VCBS repeat-containing protein [Verrucomicrobia bacterium]|nr:VCBS repeat-containing protein [Verrucomicrobiota bacterium]